MHDDMLKAQAEWNSQLMSQSDRTDPNKEMVKKAFLKRMKRKPKNLFYPVL
jgi:hypothetical protein